MEYTKDILLKLRKKQLYNKKYNKYFYRMYKEFNNKNFLNRADEIHNCLGFWDWDMYIKNKLLDLQKVNRCKSRFCPNCKSFDSTKFIHKFRHIITDYMSNYHFYFLTLTIPSCPGEELEDTLKKLNNAFAKFKERYSYPKLTPSGKKSKKAYHDRLIDIIGGIRVLEITYNYKNGYHPHYHCFVMTDKKIDDILIQKKHIARHSTKRKKTDLKSDLEMQISRVWAEIWYSTNIKLNDYKLNNTYFNEEKKYKVLEVDFREFDENGIYETFKYAFKDTDIPNYDVFKTLYFAVYRKRLRQGFGALYNVKVDDKDLECGEHQELLLEFFEDPVKITTKGITELLTTYKEYKKISRFVPEIQDDIKNQ